MFSNVGTSELVVVGIVILVLFGSTKLKELARGLGEAAKEIKKIEKDIETDEK